jgi:hypothetical protein
MADEEQVADQEQEKPRRPRRTRPSAGTGSDGLVPAAVAARRAAQQVADFTGRSPECVISIERSDEGWKVGVEVVESTRIPDTQDVLAIYEVSVDRHGDLVSYRRTRRYARGQLDERCR